MQQMAAGEVLYIRRLSGCYMILTFSCSTRLIYPVIPHLEDGLYMNHTISCSTRVNLNGSAMHHPYGFLLICAFEK